MKVFKMSKLEILKFEIKNKLIFIEEQMLKSKKTDNQVTDKIPDYLDEISRLEKENTDLKAQSKQLDQEHSKDLKKVENLVFELSKLMENNNA
jgi:cell division protein FtsB